MSATAEPINTSNFNKHTSSNLIQRRLLARFHSRLMRVIAELDPDSFLDAGCGEGFVANDLGRRFPGLAITGFDVNPASVRVARNKAWDANFLVGSIYETPFSDRSFDVTGCFEVLEHMHNPDAALKELLRVSQRAVVLSVPQEPWFCTANMLRGKNLNIHPIGSDEDHRQFWTRDGFREFVNQYAEVFWMESSFPWTICAAMKR